MNEAIKGLERVPDYVDDAIVFAADISFHVANTKELCLRLRKHNLRRSTSKTTIDATDAGFFGPTISPAGIMSNAEKVEALMKIPVPEDLDQVRYR